jgi:hypothetical protein
VVWFRDRLCVFDIISIWEMILKEAHEITYSIHPGSEKMYQDLKKILVVRHEKGDSRCCQM